MVYGAIYGKFQMKEELPSYDDMLRITQSYGKVDVDWDTYYNDAGDRRSNYYAALYDSTGGMVCNNVSVHKAACISKLYYRLKDIVLTECLMVLDKI